MQRSQQDAVYMKMSLSEAAKALQNGEVPIGCVIVWEDGRIIGSGYNTRETEKNALGHAECNAITQACETMHGWRLHRATLYVTVEPCPMCAGAIMNARIPRVVYGCNDPKAGVYGSVFDLNAYAVNHKPCVVSGVLAEEASVLLREFFAKLRERNLRKDKSQPPVK